MATLARTQPQACMRNAFRGVGIGGMVHSAGFWAFASVPLSIAREVTGCL